MIQSDICLNWYKSAAHFHDVQNLLNEFNTKSSGFLVQYYPTWKSRS